MVSDGDATLLSSQSAVTLLGRLVSTGAGFLLTIVAVRLVPQSTYGTYVLFTAVAAIAQRIGDLGLDRGVDYFLPQYLHDGDYGRSAAVFWRAFILAGGISTLVVGLLALVTPELAAALDIPKAAALLPVFGIVILFKTSVNMTGALFRAAKQAQLDVLVIDVAFPLLRVALVSAALVAGAGLAGFVYGHIAAIIVAAVFGWVLVVVKLPWVRSTVDRAPDTKRLLSYSMPLVFATLLFTVVGQADSLILGLFGTSADVATYRVAYTLSANVLLVNAALASAYKPFASEAAGIDTEAVESRYELITHWTLLLSLPVVGTILSAPEIYIELLFTSQYTDSTSVLVILVFAYLATILAGPDGTTLEGLGYSRLLLANNLLLLCINVAVGVALVGRFGPVGVAIGTLAGYIAKSLLTLTQIRYLVGIDPFTNNTLALLASAIAAAGAGVTVRYVLGTGLAAATVVPVVVVTVYLVLISMTRSFRPEDATIAARIDNMLGLRLFQRLLRY